MTTIQSGTRIENNLRAYVRPDQSIRPLRDNIVLEPLEWEPSKTIAVAYKGKPLRGRVLAVGPGTYQKKYNGPKGKRTRMWESKQFTPTEVKVGQVVELGGLEIGGYLHNSFYWGHKQVVLCREADICILVSNDAA